MARFGQLAPGGGVAAESAPVGRPHALKSHEHVCLLGAALDGGDLGVTAQTLALIHLIRTYNPGARISLLIEHPSPEPQVARVGGQTVSVEVVNGRLEMKRPVWDHLLFLPLLALFHRVCRRFGWLQEKPSRSRWIETLKQASWLGELQGGEGFSDERGLRDFFSGCLPTLAAISFGRPPYLLPQSYGPHGTTVGLMLARFVARRCRGLFARDLASVQVGITLAGRFPAPPVEFCPDLAFALPAGDLTSDAIEPALPAGAPVFGLNVNGRMYNDGFAKTPSLNLKLDYTGLMPELARALLESDPQARLLLIPHMVAPPGHPENDREACEHVAAALPEALRTRVHLLRELADPCAVKSAIGRCDFFVGSRLHACIAALSQEIPCVAIGDSWRVEGVFASAGMQASVIDARYDEAAAALRFVLQQARERAQQRERLAEALAPVRERLLDVFSRLFAPSRRPF
ncbi:MAG TPA: polysaccharide pyruvyl transferase family protein [Kiritimatiellia bacterium]|nr:polysaccharide pyruvyl transferase family protein [Kiritimatiellia bacterium]